MVARVLRDLGGRRSGGPGIVVFNDEAHHCCQDKPVDAGPKLSRDEQADVEEARVWFRGLQAVAGHIGVKAVYDLSATPYGTSYGQRGSARPPSDSCSRIHSYVVDPIATAPTPAMKSP